MKKTYKSKLRGYSIVVNINGKGKHIEFKKGFVIYSLMGCTFTTENEEIQKAMESHPDFNYKFWTDDKEPEVHVEEPKEEPKAEKKVKRYTPKK